VLILGARLASRLGGPRLSRWLYRAASERDPSSPRVRISRTAFVSAAARSSTSSATAKRTQTSIPTTRSSSRAGSRGPRASVINLAVNHPHYVLLREPS
jgi:hypothetical protein